jgi:hypothetical protein
MPYLPVVGTLVKSDRRAQWTALKSKHSKAIAARKIDFSSKLGPALDKYQVPVKAVTKLFIDEKLNLPAVQKVLVAARPLDQIAQHYLDQVKGMGDPAEKELSAFLKGVIADCAGWEQVSDMFEKDAVPTVGAVQLAAVKGLYGPLDRLSSQLENLGKSLPMARADLKAAPTKTTKPATKPVKLSAAEWSQVNSLTQKEWAQILRAKVDGIIASADSLASQRSAVLQDVAPLLVAVTRFDARSDYETFKDRAQTVAATSLPAFHQQAQSFSLLQADSEIKSRLGFDSGLPLLQNTRASKAVSHGREYAELLIQGIRKLP